MFFILRVFIAFNFSEKYNYFLLLGVIRGGMEGMLVATRNDSRDVRIQEVSRIQRVLVVYMLKSRSTA